jgi:tRNA A37 threonylcarbamoyladenosine modification protein TsaB
MTGRSFRVSATTRYDHTAVLTLALDTSTRAGSVAVVHGTTVLSVVHGDATRTHGERLPDELDRALKGAHVQPRDLELLVVASGPGAFTGLRIGLAAMQGLAMVLNVPVIAVSALDALALAALAARRPPTPGRATSDPTGGRPPTPDQATSDPAGGRPPTPDQATSDPTGGRPPTPPGATSDPTGGRPPTPDQATSDPTGGRPPTPRGATSDPAGGRPPTPDQATSDPASSAPPTPPRGTSDPAPTPPPIAAWMDAQRGEVFTAYYLPPPGDDGGVPIPAAVPIVGTPDVLLRAMPPNGGVLFICDGAERYRAQILQDHSGHLVMASPTALAPFIASIGNARAARGEAGPPHALQPLYVRRPDAELERARRSADESSG